MPLDFVKRSWLGRHVGDTRVGGAIIKGVQKRKFEKELSKVKELMENTHDFRHALYAPLVDQVAALAEVDPAGAAAQLLDFKTVLRIPENDGLINNLQEICESCQSGAMTQLEDLQAHKAKLDTARGSLELKLEALEQRTPFDQEALRTLREKPLNQARLEAEQELLLSGYQGILKSLQDVRALLSMRALKGEGVSDGDVAFALDGMRGVLREFHSNQDTQKLNASLMRGMSMSKLPAAITKSLLNTLRAHEVSAVLAADLKSVKPAEELFASVFSRARVLIGVLEGELKRLEDLTVDPSFNEAARALDAPTELALKQEQRQQQVALQALREQVQESSRLLKHHERPKVSATPAKTLDIQELLAAPPVISSAMPAQQAGRAMQKRMKALMKSSSAQERADLVLDMRLKSDKQLKETLAAQNAWTLEELNAEQEAWLDACIAAIRKHVKPEHETSLNLETQEMRIGEQPFGVERVLGQGGFGTVSLFSARTSGSLPMRVAVKRMNAANNDKARQNIDKEIRNHYHLMRGPKDAPGRAHVVELLDVVQDDEGGLNMVMELAAQGDLHKNRLGLNISSQSGIVSQAATAVLQARQLEQLVQGMIYLRDQGMTHFDLKPENVFMTADGTLKIGDFGSGGISTAEHGGQLVEPGNSTEPYRARGGLELDGMDSSQDAFALGRIAELMAAQKFNPKSQGTSQSTGVTGELLRALTDSTGAVRPSLEAVLESPLLVQARNVDADKVATLNRLTLDYNRKLDAVLRQEWSSFEAQLQDRMAEVPLFKLPRDEAAPLEILSFLQEKLTRVGQHLIAYQKGAGENAPAALAAIRRDVDNSLQDADSIANFEREFLPFSRWVEVEKKRQLLDHPDLKEITAQLKAASDEVTASARTA